MCAAGLMVAVTGLVAARREIAQARGLDKLAALSDTCFAIPLAAFGALHLFGGREYILGLVPAYMPWPMFWVYFVGSAMLAASLSIATKIGARWAGLLFGIQMFLFVAMIHLPGAVSRGASSIPWTIVFRESSFGGGAWILAGKAGGWREPRQRTLINVGAVFVALASLLFGVEHFLHPFGLPGVPLAKEMPPWLPGRALIDYATGAALLAVGGSILARWHTRAVATWVGGWILLLVLVIYAPFLVWSLAQSETGTRIVGINYFCDTLLFDGTILALASATPRSRVD